MTKEELLNKKFSIADFGERKDALYFNDLMSFFESNVVIPKGENRHPYADVLHEWVEGSDDIESYYNSTSGWVKADTAISVCHLEYRIKPKEPVYEWQWLIVCTIGGIPNKLSDFMTQEEWDNQGRGDWCFESTRLEKTKRERK